MEKIYEIGGYIYKPVELSFDIVNGIADLKLRNYQQQIVPNVTITAPVMFNIFEVFYNKLQVVFNGSTISHGEIVGHELQWAKWNNEQNWADSTSVIVPVQNNNQVSYIYNVTGLAPDERYRIRIRSIGDAGHVSNWKEIIQETDEVPVIVLPKIPTVPTTFTATKSNQNQSITFTVGGATTPSPTTITLYEVQYRSTASNQGNWRTRIVNHTGSSNYTQTLLVVYGFWEMRARTKNSDGNYSPWKELGQWLHIFNPNDNGGGNSGIENPIGGAPGSGGGVITQPGLNP